MPDTQSVHPSKQWHISLLYKYVRISGTHWARKEKLMHNNRIIQSMFLLRSLSSVTVHVSIHCPFSVSPILVFSFFPSLSLSPLYSSLIPHVRHQELFCWSSETNFCDAAVIRLRPHHYCGDSVYHYAMTEEPQTTQSITKHIVLLKKRKKVKAKEKKWRNEKRKKSIKHQVDTQLSTRTHTHTHIQ